MILYLCTGRVEPVEAERENEFLAVSVYDILGKGGEISKEAFMKLSRRLVMNAQ